MNVGHLVLNSNLYLTCLVPTRKRSKVTGATGVTLQCALCSHTFPYVPTIQYLIPLIHHLEGKWKTFFSSLFEVASKYGLPLSSVFLIRKYPFCKKKWFFWEVNLLHANLPEQRKLMRAECLQFYVSGVPPSIGTGVFGFSNLPLPQRPEVAIPVHCLSNNHTLVLLPREECCTVLIPAFFLSGINVSNAVLKVHRVGTLQEILLECSQQHVIPHTISLGQFQLTWWENTFSNCMFLVHCLVIVYISIINLVKQFEICKHISLFGQQW